MKKILLTTALTVATAAGTIVPAFADGSASTRNILIGGAAAAIGITNYNHKRRARQQEQQEQARRQQSYNAWYYHKYGVYPTEAQFKDWYYRTYGVNPS